MANPTTNTISDVNDVRDCIVDNDTAPVTIVTSNDDETIDDGNSSSGGSFAESPADHVFRAMVCRGDDVLCGDGRVMVPTTTQSTTMSQSQHTKTSSIMDADVLAAEPDDPAGSSSTSAIYEQQPAHEDDNDDDDDDRSSSLMYEFEIGSDGIVGATTTSNCEPPAMSGTTQIVSVGEAAAATKGLVGSQANVGLDDVLEPSIRVLDAMVTEMDPIEQEFTDAENYVLESGEISADSNGEFK